MQNIMTDTLAMAMAKLEKDIYIDKRLHSENGFNRKHYLLMLTSISPLAKLNSLNKSFLNMICELL